MSDLPDFHLSTVLRDWSSQSPGQAFRLADALTGVAVFGATGSGKTSGPAKHLAMAYLAADFGGLVLCAKKEECRQWKKWAAVTGRLDDLVIFDARGLYRFNFLDWEAERPGEGGGISINIVALLDEVGGAIASGAGKAESGGGDNKFFEYALHLTNTNLVDLQLLARLPVSLPLMREIVNTAPQTSAEAQDSHWQQASTCWATLAEADAATRDGDPEIRNDYEQCRSFWLQEWATLSERTRSIIQFSFSILVTPFITRPLRKLFSTDTNITPEDAFDGKIIIIDLPVQEYRLAGILAQRAFKFCFQVAVMRREPPTDGSNLRPCFLWCDEAQTFVSNFDAEYQAVARSAGGCTVYLTQNRASLRRVLGDADAVDSLLGNLQCTIFCQQSSPETNQWAAELLGEHWVRAIGTNTNRPGGGGPTGGGVSVSERRQFFVEPSTFTVLRRGGPKNDNLVDAIVYNGGSQFPTLDGREILPYAVLTFDQNK